MAGFVQLRKDGSIAVLTLNRPDKLNALSAEVEDQLLAALTGSLVADAGALVIHGEGRAFCAGADVTEFRGLDPASILEYYRTSGQLYEVLADLPIPTVVAIHGYCIGGGFEMSLACDVRVVEESAVFGLPEAALGILPSSGGLTRLVRMIGAARAKEVMLWHERLTASQANDYGLVTELVADGTSLEIRDGGCSAAGCATAVGGAHDQTGE